MIIDKRIQIPAECTQHIFSYLMLIDCLQFASSSSSCMREILPSLRIRRDHLLKPYVLLDEQTIDVSLPTPVVTNRLVIGRIDEVLQNQKGISSLKIYYLPTLQQRMTQLAKLIPTLHPMYALVQELHKTIQQQQPNLEDDIDICCNSHMELMKLFTSIMLPLKLHATILNYTILSNHHDIKTIELYKYMGDVLCMTYLLYDYGPTYCQYADGSMTQQQSYINTMIQQQLKGSVSCYLSWVLIHSTILRTKYFTKLQLQRFGISDLYRNALNGNTTTDECVDDHLNHSTTATNVSSSNIPQHIRQFGWTIPLDMIRTDQFMKSELCLVYDDFGPLSPSSFRGRDIVRVRDVSADAILECFIYLNHHHMTSANRIPDGIWNRNSREALEWMFIVHEQTFRTRPMSVRHPVIRFG